VIHTSVDPRFRVGGAVLLALLVVAVLLLRRRTPAPAPNAPDEMPPESPGAPEAD